MAIKDVDPIVASIAEGASNVICVFGRFFLDCICRSVEPVCFSRVFSVWLFFLRMSIQGESVVVVGWEHGYCENGELTHRKAQFQRSPSAHDVARQMHLNLHHMRRKCTSKRDASLTGRLQPETCH
jgi:hypothetical protein